MDESRSWYQLHWLTWLIIGLVILALIDRQVAEQVLYGVGGLGNYSERSIFGWPLVHLDLWETGLQFPDSRNPGPGPPFPPREFYYDWLGWQLIGNGLVCTFLLGATAFVCEAWVRSQRRAQFGLRHLMAATAVLSVLMALVTFEWEGTYRDLGDDFQMTWSIISWSDIGRPIRWPFLFAFACAIYTLGWLVFRTSSGLFAVMSDLAKAKETEVMED